MGNADVVNIYQIDLRGKRTRYEIVSFGRRRRQDQQISSEEKGMNGTCRKKEGKTKEKKEKSKKEGKEEIN